MSVLVERAYVTDHFQVKPLVDPLSQEVTILSIKPCKTYAGSGELFVGLDEVGQLCKALKKAKADKQWT